mmetsp:Transcript_43762/g.126445  ORF Transcript_43762/g.126445 Transcript_43762/m.126445 type:complete len:1161 (+) Transcript_43762:61-3543(+)
MMVDTQVATDGSVWEVVGGSGRGGIVVRSAKDTSSPQLLQRLSTGALVRSLAYAPDGRMNYELLAGTGPASGWVSTSVRGKELLVKTAKRAPAGATETRDAPRSAGEACSAEELEAALPALRWYSEQLAQSRNTAHQLEARDPSTRSGKPPTSVVQMKPPAAPSEETSVESRDADVGEEPSSSDALMMPVGKTGGMMKVLPLRQSIRPNAQAAGSRCPTGLKTQSSPPDAQQAKVALPGSKQARCQPLHRSAVPLSDLHAAGPKDTAPCADSTATKGKPDVSEQSSTAGIQGIGSAQETDGEDQPCCPRCQLPIGDWGYLNADSLGALMHSECRAQLIMELAKEDDKARETKDAALKDEHRKAHRIGWSVEHVPQNTSFFERLQCCEAANNMCCLVLDEGSHSVRVVPTIDAATCINLEYLSLALQVRRREGREPLFSLDPVDCSSSSPCKPQDVVQRKRFEPSWLAGTSVGDVMFQADYHLKELSMGEYEQPVVGMKSCFDLAGEDSFKKEWRAREWFIVKQAGIYLSDGNVLTPHVKMGVEAREQICGPNGIVDALLTRRDHPLVKYAEAFTRNFDLIAERKSVIYHLRELAKASVLAKYLVDDKVTLEESWFTLAGETREAGPMEVPQLWNERSYSKIHVKDGKLVDAERGISTSMHGVYGGVAFQLEQVPTMQASRLPRAGATVTARALALAGGGKARSFGQIPGAPKGVDLNLDGFDLTVPVPLPRQSKSPVESGTVLLPEVSAAYGKAFWFTLACNSGSAFTSEDRLFFGSLFNPCLSDRHKDGNQFVPPQTSFGYIQGLRTLVKKEEELQEQRRKHFLSKGFLEDHAGSLFPGSWDASIALALEHTRQASPTVACGEGWSPSGAMAANLHLMLKTAAPVFDKRTEDGTRFRIYRVSSFEVRTTQRHDEKEVIEVVFSSVSTPQAHPSGGERSAAEDEKVIKVTEYVEGVKGTEPEGPSPGLPHHYFAVVTTAAGSMIVTERLADGALAWAANPEGLGSRCALARVTGCSSTGGAGLSLADLRAPQAEGSRAAWRRSGSECRCHTRRCLELALPAGRKGWGALAESQRLAAARLGVQTARGWDERAAPVWRLSWWDLTEQQRGAARALGVDDDSWEDMAREPLGQEAEAGQEVPEVGGDAGAATRALPSCACES